MNWQLIETVPKDGTWVLIFGSGHYAVAHFDGEEWCDVGDIGWDGLGCTEAATILLTGCRYCRRILSAIRLNSGLTCCLLLLLLSMPSGKRQDITWSKNDEPK